MFQIIDIPQNNPCENCHPCMRMRLMEMGFVPGVELEIKEKRRGMFLVKTFSENGNVEQTFALRKEELDRICLKLN